MAKTRRKKTGFISGMPLQWRINTASFLKEVLENYPNGPNGTNGGAIFVAPFNIFKDILSQVALRASELNDPVMNALMCRLALYGEADQYSPDYDNNVVQKCLKHQDYLKWSAEKRKDSTKD